MNRIIRLICLLSGLLLCFACLNGCNKQSEEAPADTTVLTTALTTALDTATTADVPSGDDMQLPAEPQAFFFLNDFRFLKQNGVDFFLLLWYDN